MTSEYNLVVPKFVRLSQQPVLSRSIKFHAYNPLLGGGGGGCKKAYYGWCLRFAGDFSMGGLKIYLSLRLPSSAGPLIN